MANYMIYASIEPTPIYPKYVSEDRSLTVDFSSILASGETITEIISMSANVQSGSDPSPQNILSGSPTVNATNIVQMITGGVQGTLYMISVTVSTSSGEVLTGKTIFWVIAG